jgi:radical SAM-linked protein
MPPINLEDLKPILLRVEKPARYTGGELHSVVKDPSRTPIRIALAFPDAYEIGMSHLGLKILYELLNRRPDVAAERVFCPWPDMEREMRQRGLPLFTLETRTPVRELDVVGFSLQHELCYTNLLTMLDLAGIPLRSADRREEDPLVIAGGPVAFSPEPVAEFIDLFLIGDGEEALPRLLDEHLRLKGVSPSGAPRRRERILRSLTRIEGVYVPSLYETALDETGEYEYVKGPRAGLPVRVPQGAGTPEHPARRALARRRNGGAESGGGGVPIGAAAPPEPTAPGDFAPGEEPLPFPIRRAVLWDLDRYPFPARTIVPFTEVVHDRVSVEIARGCVEGCRFCQAGIIYRPVRERNTDSILSSIVRGLEETGHDEASIVSLSDADYSCFPNLVEKVMDALEPRGVGLGLSSLRVYGLTDKVTEQIARVKKTGFTIAPEAGTQRLRDVINKGIRDADIDKAASTVFRAGWPLVKLYFMIGQPTETDEDVVGIARTAERVMALGRAAKAQARARAREACQPEPDDALRGPSVHLSASSFIPKPHSTFQWARMNSPEELRAKQERVRRSLRDRGIKFKHHSVDESVLECVLSRGDRRLGRVIERAWRAGARFDSWTEHFKLDRWLEALAAEGLDVSLFTSEIPLEARLPWDHIDTLVDKGHLARDYRKALETRFQPACMRPVKLEDGRVPRPEAIVCYNCGVACDLEKIRDDRARVLAGSLRTPAELRAQPPAAAPAQHFRYRLAFRKRGTMAYLSHLDLVRTLGRALRRARVPLRMSQGFSPHAEISFGPALALGIESLAECLDFETVAPIDLAATLEALAATLPDDLGPLAIAPVEPQAPSLSAAVGGALYTLELPWPEGRDVASTFEAFLAKSEAFVVRRRKDREAKVEVRGAILLLGVEPPRVATAGADAAACAAPAAARVRLRLGLRMGPQGAVKPAEVLEAVLGAPPAELTLRRDLLLVAAGDGWVSSLHGAGAIPSKMVERGAAAGGATQGVGVDAPPARPQEPWPALAQGAAAALAAP